MNPLEGWLNGPALFPLLPGNAAEQAGAIVASLVLAPLSLATGGMLGSV